VEPGDGPLHDPTESAQTGAVLLTPVSRTTPPRPRSRSSACPTSRAPGTPTGSPCAARTGSRTTPAGPAPEADRDQLRAWLGRQRLDQRPQFIRDDPRPRLVLPHGYTNEHPNRQSHDQPLLSGPLSGGVVERGPCVRMRLPGRPRPHRRTRRPMRRRRRGAPAKSGPTQ